MYVEQIKDCSTYMLMILSVNLQRTLLFHHLLFNICVATGIIQKRYVLPGPKLIWDGLSGKLFSNNCSVILEITETRTTIYRVHISSFSEWYIMMYNIFEEHNWYLVILIPIHTKLIYYHWKYVVNFGRNYNKGDYGKLWILWNFI